MSLVSSVISCVLAVAHTVTGLVALFLEKDLTYGLLLDVGQFEQAKLLPEGSWAKFLRCACH